MSNRQNRKGNKNTSAKIRNGNRKVNRMNTEQVIAAIQNCEANGDTGSFYYGTLTAHLNAIKGNDSDIKGMSEYKLAKEKKRLQVEGKTDTAYFTAVSDRLSEVRKARKKK